MNSFGQLLRKLGIVKLGILFVTFVGVIAFLAYMVMKVSEPEMGLLFSGLDPNDASKMVTQLETSSTEYKLDSTGTQIFVPKEKVSRLRLEMAENGLPGSGVVGYEIFDKGDLLSLTSGLMDINQIRAMEGELTKSIQSIDGVSGARVHLVVPKKELFSKEVMLPSASIILNMKGIMRLSRNQISAIKNLVASAVQNLTPGRISIVDNHGNLLSRSSGDDHLSEDSLNHEEKKTAVEKKLSQSIEQIISKNVGYGNVRATVSADMDFNRISQNSIKYDPSGRVARSSSTIEENNDSVETDLSSNVTAENGIPGEGQESTSGKNSNKSKRTEENINFELSSTTTNTIKQIGDIKKLSVAVIIDGTYKKDESGNEIYVPRTREEIETFTKIAKTAIGFQEDRGDIVEVVSLQFKKENILEGSIDGKKQSIIDMLISGKTIEILLLGIFGLIISLFVLKPIVMKVTEIDEEIIENDKLLLQLNNQQLPQLNTNTQQIQNNPNIIPQTQPNYINNPDNKNDNNSSFKKNDESDDLGIKTISKKVFDMVDNNTEEAVQLIRNWMYSK